MSKFRLTNGSHSFGHDRHGIPHTYYAGDVIETDTPLAERFPDRFVQVEDDTETTVNIANAQRRNAMDERGMKPPHVMREAVVSGEVVTMPESEFSSHVR